MSNTLTVHKNRANTVQVSLNQDLSDPDLEVGAEIRTNPSVDAELIVTWDVSYFTDGTDGKLVLRLDEATSAAITHSSGYMDIKIEVEGVDQGPVFDKPIEVSFIGSVTAEVAPV